jgi:hypothetical protein
MPPMGRATIHGEPDTVISSSAHEEINATAHVGDLGLKISDGQCELIASIQINLNIVAEILGHQKPADMAGGDSLCGGAPRLSVSEPAKCVLWYWWCRSHI